MDRFKQEADIEWLEKIAFERKQLEIQVDLDKGRREEQWRGKLKQELNAMEGRLNEAQSECRSLTSELRELREACNTREEQVKAAMDQKDALITTAENKARELASSQERLTTEMASLKDEHKKTNQAAAKTVTNESRL